VDTDGGNFIGNCGKDNGAKAGYCAFHDYDLNTGKFAMQSIWSNAAGACVMTGKLGLEVAAPAPQKSSIGAKVSVQISTTQSGHARRSPAPAVS